MKNAGKSVFTNHNTLQEKYKVITDFNSAYLVCNVLTCQIDSWICQFTHHKITICKRFVSNTRLNYFTLSIHRL